MRVFAAFMLETQVKSLSGNVAAGSADMGFVITPDAWECFKWAGRHKIDYNGWEYQTDKLGTDKPARRHPSSGPASCNLPLFSLVLARALPLLVGRSNLGVYLPSCVEKHTEFMF